MAFRVGVESPDDLMELFLPVLVDPWSPVFVHEPGPIKLNNTGNNTIPWKAPNIITKNIILKKVTNRYEGANPRPITPKIVDVAPCRIGMPKAYKLAFILSLGLPDSTIVRRKTNNLVECLN